MAIIAMLVKKINENHKNVAYRTTHVPPISLTLSNAWPPIMLLKMQKPKL